MKNRNYPILALLVLLIASACKPDVTCKDVANPFSCAEENPDNWYWVDVDGMVCRDGSATGIGVRMQRSSRDLIIFLQGGGACWDAVTCEGNPASFSQGDFADWAGGSGYSGFFNSQSSDNPFDNWNVVYIPYCTGDVHAGQQPNGNVPGGPQNQQFVGHTNMTLALDKIQPEFSDANRVLLIGASAGGYGTVFNYTQVAASFPDATVSLINDSGPLFEDDSTLTDCLQQKWRDLWLMNNSLPAGCTACFGADGDGIVNLYDFLATTYSDGNFGMIASKEDEVIRSFFGLGRMNCGASDPLSAGEYAAGITDLHDNVLIPTGRWSTFIPLGDGHVYSTSNSYNTQRIDGNRLREWCEGVVNGQVNNLQE